MKQSSPVTMTDVARLAGVSQATVSLVLNKTGGKRVSKATQDRVMSAVEQLGYRVNSAAKTLREGRSQLIGFLSDRVATSPFAGQIIEGAQQRASEEGALLLIVNTGGDAAVEEQAIESLLARQVDGIVYAAMYHRVLTLPPALHDVSTVVLNAEVPAADTPAIVPDEFQGGADATRHLIESGHSRIGFLNVNSLSSRLPAAVDRFEGYLTELRAAGLSLDSRYVRHGQGNVEDGFHLAMEVLSEAERPTALFCGNDRMAWGAYQACQTLGLDIPGDVSIVGFDDQELISHNLRPRLTTVALPFLEMGRAAVDALVTGKTDEAEVRKITCPLVTRESVAAPKADRR